MNTGLLYNYRAGQWVQVTPSIQGFSQHPVGWFGWEGWHHEDVAPLCLDFDEVQASEARIYHVPKVSWPLSSSDVGPWVAEGYCWETNTFIISLLQPYEWWLSHTP